MSDNLDTRQQLVLETARVPWRELQYFFARNMAVYVSDKLDLIDVASQVADDNKRAIQNWMDQGQIMHVTTGQALEWHNNDASVWAVVVKPWVLVQNIAQNK